MRFVHVNHRYEPYVGGSERYMQEVSTMLSAIGHDVSVVTSDASDLEYFWNSSRQAISAPERERLDGVDVHRVKVRHFPGSPLIFQASRRLMGEASRLPFPAQPFAMVSSKLPWMPGMDAALTDNGPVDLIHAANLGLEGLALVAEREARRNGVPFMLTPFIHLGSSTDDVARRYVSMPHQRYLLHMATHTIVMTHSEAHFVTSLGICPESVTISGVGINLDEVSGGDGERFRHKYGIEGGLVGTAGAVAFDKGSKDLVMAVMDLRRRGHDVKLALAGPRLQQFDEWFANLGTGTTHGIHLLGFIPPDEKRDMLAALDVLTMPSRTESFGIAYLEGWANRKPVLAAIAGAVPELVRENENGILVEFGAVAEIASGILHLLSSPATAEKLGDAGYALTTSCYTWPMVLKRVRTAYSRALGFELPEITYHD
ncbi:glycosyltransferase family 4 protein [soil metagenome]